MKVKTGVEVVLLFSAVLVVIVAVVVGRGKCVTAFFLLLQSIQQDSVLPKSQQEVYANTPEARLPPLIRLASVFGAATARRVCGLCRPV